MITSKQILRAINCPHLSLYKGNGYWYFVYSNPNGNVYEDKSVYTMRLSDLPLESWVEDGRECVRIAEA